VNQVARLGWQTTLRGQWLLPMSGPPIRSGWVRIRAGLIAAIGRGPPPGSPTECVDLGDVILLPGLVNAHTHLEFSALEAPLDASGGLPGWIARVVAARRGRHADDAAALETSEGIQRGLSESAAAGVTAIGEIATATLTGRYAGPGPAVRVFREGLGLRSPALKSVPGSVSADLDRLARSGLAGGISPHAPYSVASLLGRRLIEAACRRHVPVAMHLCESREEEQLLRTGEGPFRHLLEELGAWDPASPPTLLPPAAWISLLARARRGIVVHATHISHDPEALVRLTRHRDRLAVAVCPRTARRIADTLPPVRLLIAAGLRVAIGTDSRASNPDLSVLAECRSLVDAGLISPAESLRMVTLDGAWALGLEHRCGCLAVGRPADIAILRPADPAADPWAAALDPATAISGTIRHGRLIAGDLAQGVASSLSRSARATT
jgi:cytosine/adenosine deaminase-related metal-dependent hydrolase